MEFMLKSVREMRCTKNSARDKAAGSACSGVVSPCGFYMSHFSIIIQTKIVRGYTTTILKIVAGKAEIEYV